MDLTQTSVKKDVRTAYKIDGHGDDWVVALAGNPNTGKSTIFNNLTGLNQHTGNWPGKTVTHAQGTFIHRQRRFTLVDLPGTYSLFAHSVDEEVARDFICSGAPRVTVVVADATCLERNLNLALQVMEITGNVVLCVNLLDEAQRKKIRVNLTKLAEILGIPVIGTSARDGIGLKALKDAIYQMAAGELPTSPVQIPYGEAVEKCLDLLQPILPETLTGNSSSRWVALRLLASSREEESPSLPLSFWQLQDSDETAQVLDRAGQILRQVYPGRSGLRDHLATCIVAQAEKIAGEVLYYERQNYNHTDRKLDSILTSRVWGIPVMLALLGVVFFITIKGANYPSAFLTTVFFQGQEHLTRLFLSAGWPLWLHGLLVLGMYQTLTWVIAVMLPPMAIFFPLFTFLEDLGYLPRIAFNLDNFFKKACAHGKQALTMCMGFGCNAAGIISCRIIDSPRERLIAIITNNFVPCNGRFPTLIALATIFIAGEIEGTGQSLVAALSILVTIVLAVCITLTVSKILSKTILQGLPSSFSLELPPYRKPQFGRIIIRSLLDRTLFVLTRAIIVAAPAGIITWTFANIHVGSLSLLQHGANLLNPFAHLIGMDGFILMAFILGLPANEIVLPILIMSYVSAGQMIELSSLQALRDLFVANGWTWGTAVCTMLFCLNHFPCGTTLLTIRQETQSLKWTLISFVVPTAAGVLLCFFVAQGLRLLGLM